MPTDDLTFDVGGLTPDADPYLSDHYDPDPGDDLGPMPDDSPTSYARPDSYPVQRSMSDPSVSGDSGGSGGSGGDSDSDSDSDSGGNSGNGRSDPFGGFGELAGAAAGLVLVGAAAGAAQNMFNPYGPRGHARESFNRKVKERQGSSRAAAGGDDMFAPPPRRAQPPPPPARRSGRKARRRVTFAK